MNNGYGKRGKRHNKSLQDVNIFLKAFRISPIPMAISRTSDGCFIAVNKSALKLFKFRRNEVIGHTSIDIGIWPDPHERNVLVELLLENKRIYNYEFILKAKTGKLLNILLSAELTRINSENHFVISFIDITDKKKAEQEAEKSKNRVKEILNSIADTFMAVDKKWNILYVNDAEALKITAKVLGLRSSRDFVGKKYWEVFHMYKDTAVAENLRAAMEKGVIRKWEIRSKNTGRWMETTAYPSAEGITILSVDITDRKRAEQQKDDFISIASHELKTPLTSLRAFMQLLQKEYSEQTNGKINYLLDRALKQTDKLSELVNDLLDVSRIESGKLQFRKITFDFDTLIKEVVAEILLTNKNSEIYISGTVKQVVYADRDRISQVIINLLTNAIKHSESKSKIIIGVSKLKKEILVKVQDYGVGIPKEMQEKIFHRFFRADMGKNTIVPGLGLGLYISSEIIKRQGGKLWVESVVGKGSTFYFNLPIRRSG